MPINQTESFPLPEQPESVPLDRPIWKGWKFWQIWDWRQIFLDIPHILKLSVISRDKDTKISQISQFWAFSNMFVWLPRVCNGTDYIWFYSIIRNIHKGYISEISISGSYLRQRCWGLFSGRFVWLPRIFHDILPSWGMFSKIIFNKLAYL